MSKIEEFLFGDNFSTNFKDKNELDIYSKIINKLIEIYKKGNEHLKIQPDPSKLDRKSVV